MPQKILNELSTRCEKSVEHLKSTMLGVRTGRAHPALVEEIKVDYFGTPTPIKNMGSVNVPEARQIVITPWDKTAMKAIEKAIQSSSLGITPQNDGSSIRLNLPELTQQRRVELKKMVNKMAEEGRVAVRNIRRDAIEALKKLEKDSKITEDDLKKFQKEAQDKTDAFIKKILAERNISFPEDVLTGPTAVIAGQGDIADAAKTVVDFVKKNEKASIKGGLMNDTVITDAQVNTLSELISLAAQQARLLGTLQAPASKMARVLQAKVDKEGEGNGDNTPAA